mmetsp:Transcript_10655/g.12843  ORF Transcript_10655/g.12843 Transcript_10655/m.12843 type:complete len:283 (-) Transcript_10655:1875-2723(-)
METKKTRKRLRTFQLGCGAGLTASVLLQPLDVVKTRLQGQVLLNASTRSSFLQTVAAIHKEKGLRGLWRGVVPSAIRATLGPGLYFVMLEEMRALEPGNGSFKLFFQGATARAIAGTILCPITVVKTRFEMSTSIDNPSVFRTLLKIARKERVRGLFSGLGPMLLRDVPQSGLYLFFFGSLFKPFYLSILPPSFSEANVTSLAAFSAAALSTTITLPADVVKTKLQVAPTTLSVGNILKQIVRNHGVHSLFSGLSTRLVRRPIQLTIIWTFYDYFRETGIEA